MTTSPLHKDTVLVGATNIWMTFDGGLTWAKKTSETGGFVPYVHPDHHAITFFPGSESIFFSCNDGGIFKTTDFGQTWTTINGGLQIAQMYRMGISNLHPNTILTGHQDMGTHQVINSTWSLFTMNTGDGMECIYEHDNDSIRYLESFKGKILVTYNNYPLYNIFCNNTGSGVNGVGNWITPFIMHPLHDSTLLVGKAQVWRTTNGGLSFSQVGSVSGGSGNVVALAYSPSDPQYIYAAKSNKVFVATDGNTFIDKTGSLPVGFASITSITVSNTNPEQVWVTFSGYSMTNKVWYSPDAGDTWLNYSDGLPNLPVNCIVYQNATDDGLYVGTDVGVYFRDNAMSAWQFFFTGLPNVDVEELEISYAIGKIRAATNGRGLWESDLAVDIPTVMTWVGHNSSDWNNTGNWSPHGVPTVRQDVIIPEVFSPNVYPVVNVTGLGCKHITTHPNASITIASGNSFRIEGD
jgi:photosystem II stability/assembly factor-like uncharacterized protein